VILIVALTRGGEEEGEGQTDVAVHVGTVTRATLHRYVTAYGFVQARPPAAGGAGPAGALLTPIVSGVLAEIHALEGQRVERGAVLFRLDSRLAEVAARKARQEVDFAEQAFDRQQTLLRTEGTSRKAYQEAQQRVGAARSDLAAAETELSYMRITAPLGGTVLHLRAEVGQAVDPGTVLAEVVDLDRLVVAADVPVAEAAGLAVGQAVIVGPDSARLRGRLLVVGRGVDPATGTSRMVTALPPGARLLPGQFIDLRIVAEEHAGVLAVPEVSLVSRPGAGSWIMVVEGERAVRRPVTVGLRDGGLVEVSGEGLAEGMTIVTDDAYSLPEETRIRIVAG
jgi:membrane fusion protein (multidrug efflux system)